ncbi:helix-turn-helix domain-containing protein [Alteribacillus sp. YIM 98480]|uniref:helix-turn-helix domain-containing protein n=1 Tax=Alteribacillus sp. YIM 98480 TaxID=2606599 RepID=UPI00131C0048|nr:helix-turn-helix domain-containing protein [Alteribacillus sp. YIM 98480]
MAHYSLSSLYSAIRIMDIQLDLINKGWSCNNHRHSYFEFLYCVSGEMEQWLNGKMYVLKPGDAVVIKSGMYHHTHTTEKTKYLDFHFDIEMKEIHSIFQLASEPIISNSETMNDTFSISLWVKNFIEEFQIKPQRKVPYLVQEDYLDIDSTVDILLLHSRVLELISVLARHFLTKQSQQLTGISPSQTRVAYEAANILENRHNSKFKIEDLANELNLNRSYLSQCFTKTYGMSPSEYLMRIRIREARQLLMETDLSVEHISQHLAFSSAGHFSRTFRSIMEVSPYQFRKDKKNSIQKSISYKNKIN